MTTTRTLLLIIRREVLARGRSTAYLGSAALILVLLTAGVVLPQVLGGGPVTWEVGALGEGNDTILSVATDIAQDRFDEDREFRLEVTTYDDESAARAALADGDVELVVVDGESLLRQGAVGFTGSDLQETIQQAAAVTGLDEQLTASGLGAGEVASALRADPLEVTTVAQVGDGEEQQARGFIAYAGMMLLYIALLVFGQWTLQGVTEEKASRVVEVLLSSVRPWQLLAGKVIGIGLLGLVQFGLTVGWALVLIRLTDALPLPVVPLDSAVTLVLWFVLGFGVYSVLNAAVGSLVSKAEDAQSVAFPVSMVAIVSFLASFQVLDDPSGPLGQVMTYIPFSAPFVVPIRVAFAEITIWEHALSALVALAGMAVLIRVAGRLYAGGVLNTGARISLRQAWRSADEVSAGST